VPDPAQARVVVGVRGLEGHEGEGRERGDVVNARVGGGAAERLSLVMPVKERTHHGHSEIERARRILMPSLARFLDPACVDAFWVVAPPDEVRAVVRMVEPWRDAFGIRVVSDDAVAPGAARSSGWIKQQLLKLGIARLVESPRYLVLDSDVLAVRPVGAPDLCPGGRARLGTEPLSTHPEWWRASSRILGLDLAWGDDDPVMGVTPEILDTDVVRALLDHVERHARRWPWSRRGWERVLLARRGWTEYSLYWSFLRARFDAGERYALEDGPLYASCIWRRASDFDAGFVRSLFESPRAPFSVIQSNIESLRVDDIARLVSPWLVAR
jgi:hypothetical protein